MALQDPVKVLPTLYTPGNFTARPQYLTYFR